MLRKTMTALPQ